MFLDLKPNQKQILMYAKQLLTTPQTLTDGEKAQAKTNIGAVGYSTYSEFLSTTSTVIEISSGTYTVPSDSTVIADVRGLTRHWVGGVFVKDNTATIDGGCVIANTDVTIRGSVGVGSIADGSAPNSTIYYSTTQSKLVYKNSAGTVNVLY